uniref:Myb/SANT-like domain-containing protein n=1 Tax=Davidia involucrata TaxID=16924 RepID=A0A5B6YH33_DAVIN
MASSLPSHISFDDVEVSPARWTVEQENIFIDIMEEQVISNNRLTTTFSRGSWKNIRVKFYMRTKVKYSMKQFQNKFNQLRLRYRTFTKLKKLPTGFGWDPILETATAPDDVWERYIRVQPEAKRFRNAGCPRYDKLVTIFGDTTATGKEARASTQDVSDSDDNTEDTTFSLNPPVEDVNENVEEETEQPRDRGRSRDSTSNDTRRVRSRSRASEVSDAIRSLAEASYARTNVLSQQSVNASSSSGPFTIAKCIQVLESIEEVNMQTYLKAIEKLQDKRWRETFIEMSAYCRMGWLASL